MFGEMRKVWLVLGIIAPAMSVISFVQKLFSIGLVPVLSLIIEFYRKMLYPVFDIFGHILHITIPYWYRDIFVISAVFSMSAYRVRGNLIGNINKYIELCYYTIYSISLLGCIIPVYYLVRYLRIRKYITIAKSETIEEDFEYLNKHDDEVSSEYRQARFWFDPFISVYQRRFYFGESESSESEAEFLHRIYWKYHFSFHKYLYHYELATLYMTYVAGISIIAIIFYAVNSTLWTL